MHKIRSAVFVITRVVLSGDSDTKYLIATIYNCDNTLAFRIVKNIDDIKSYYCGCISNKQSGFQYFLYALFDVIK
ncbi:MAG: hypothetical protein LBS81_00515 [Endomicrobium sp.]|jgi:hypothetical protein|nr:hypothetical protein [Endomicrobium sp.]